LGLTGGGDGRQVGVQFLSNRHLRGLQAALTHVEEQEFQENYEEVEMGVSQYGGEIYHGQPN